MNRPARLLPLLLALFVAACSSSAARQSADTLCEFRERPRPSIMLHYDKTSELFLGEINVKAFAEESRSVASALAKTIEPSYRREYRADCRNKATGAWYPCTQVIEVDLTKVEVIVRGFDMKRVARHAVAMCNKHALTLIPFEGDLRRLSAKFKCELVAKRFCPLR